MTMHRWVAAALMLALAGHAEAATIKISAKNLWKKTGITVQAGDVISITASGRWSWDGVSKWGPDGDPTDDFNAFDLFQPFDFFSQARLIAYIGDLPKQKHYGDGSFFPQMSGYFSVGSGQTFTAPYGGKLWLGFNDAAETESTGDNLGVMTAQVSILPAGATGPTVSIAAPSGVYALGQSVQVSYSCGGGTIVSCTGPVANGGALDTSVADHHAFNVTAVDDQGNATTATTTYVVADTGAAAVWPTGGAFAPTYLGTKSAIQVFYLTNPQAVAMNIASIAIGGDFYGEFHISGGTCGAVLNPRHTCKINVQYQPVNPTTARAEIDVTADLAVVPVPLWGNGTQVRTLPAALSFGDQQVGTASATQTIKLQNTEPHYLAIKEIVLSGDFALDPATTCPSSGKLALGKSCNIVVGFSPTATGARSGAVVVHGAAQIDPVSVSLSGNGT
ncbi:MAG TPA: choice-of-anchor D domain-containing protein [Rhizomicrobium sp.]|nr:choice-of-anchor D domain-containing protein [Rhizomicrobium sp.]